MTVKRLEELLITVVKEGRVKETDTVCVMINDGKGWILEPVEGITALALITEEYGKIGKQHPLFKPQICFGRKGS